MLAFVIGSGDVIELRTYSFRLWECSQGRRKEGKTCYLELGMSVLAN